MKKHIIVMIVAAFACGFAAPVFAHDDPEDMGAGPGPAHASGMTAMTHGKPGAHLAGDPGSQMAMADEAVDRSKESLGKRLTSWLGRAHNMVIHFPIALLIGALAVEVFGAWRGNPLFASTARVMLVVGALGAIAAASLGWFAGGPYLWDRNLILTAHRWLGTTIALFSIILAWYAFRLGKRPGVSRAPYFAALTAIVVAVSVQGFLGGTFMHGGIHHMDF